MRQQINYFAPILWAFIAAIFAASPSAFAQEPPVLGPANQAQGQGTPPPDAAAAPDSDAVDRDPPPPIQVAPASSSVQTFPQPARLRNPEDPNIVSVYKDDKGYLLIVDGEPFMVLGMNWTYIPIGENYSYDFWGQPEEYIEAALRYEMGLLKAMGANTIRQYPGIPARWITWIYENYGIYTVLNPLVARYGTEVNGVFIPVVDYSDPDLRAAVKAETKALVEEYRDVPGPL